MDKIKPKRVYRSQRREQQAQSTHDTVLDTAERLFRTRGWGATTIASIAMEAGVSPETIYSRFGNKKTIVHELVIRTMRGDQPQTPFLEQEQRVQILQAADGPAIIAGFAKDIAGLLARVAPLLAVVRSAAETDREMGELYADLHKTRRRNLERVISALMDKGALQAGLDRDSAVDTLWSVVSPELWTLRLHQLGATHDTNREWIKATLMRLLL
jgi:AcrR family transcriptional regulator